MGGHSVRAAERTFTGIDINTVGNPRGYWEFLPSEYYENPTKKFPVVIFLHGLGEGGNGTTDLYEVLKNGPPDILNTPTHPLYDLFENEGVIVLCPQITNNTWWTEARARPFIDFAQKHYRVDLRQMYLTGLSSGCQGTHDTMNNNPLAHQFAAFVTCAVRGRVTAGGGDYLAKRSAYWTLTAKADFSANAFDSVDNLAGFFLGTAPTDVAASYPDRTVPSASAIDRTASFYPDTGWQWETGVVTNTDSHIKATIFKGSSHNSWDRTYNNLKVWTWMFAQQKPTVTFNSPAEGTLAQAGSSIAFSVNSVNKDGTPISGTDIVWSSSLDGSLGTGSEISTNSLSIGVHEVTCTVSDTIYHQAIEKKVTVTVLYTSAFTAQFDFGDSSMETVGWNNITDKNSGTIENAIDTVGASVGVRVAITDGFDGIQTGGIAASDVYPVTVQQDTMFVANATPSAQLLVQGLNPLQTFDFTFFASRSAANNRTANYTINGNTVSLNAANNTAQTVTISNATPSALGEILIDIACDDEATYGYLGSMVITTTGAPPTPYENWQNTHFTPVELQDSLTSGDLADPDLDGFNNLLEYAFNQNPREKSNASLFSVVQTGPLGEQISFSFQRDPTKTDLIYEVCASDNLLQWTTIARSSRGGITTDVSNRTLSIQESGTSPVTVSLVDATTLTGTSFRFYRIHVTR